MYSHHLHVHGCCLGTSWTRSSGSSGSPLQELSVSGRRSTVGGGDVVPGQQQLVLVSSRKLFAPESSFLRCSASSSTTSSSGAPSSSSPPPAPAPAPAPVVSDNAKKISSRTQVLAFSFTYLRRKKINVESLFNFFPKASTTSNSIAPRGGRGFFNTRRGELLVWEFRSRVIDRTFHGSMESMNHRPRTCLLLLLSSMHACRR
jgi:hypothetical protein